MMRLPEREGSRTPRSSWNRETAGANDWLAFRHTTTFLTSRLVLELVMQCTERNQGRTRLEYSHGISLLKMAVRNHEGANRIASLKVVVRIGIAWGSLLALILERI